MLIEPNYVASIHGEGNENISSSIIVLIHPNMPDLCIILVFLCSSSYYLLIYYSSLVQLGHTHIILPFPSNHCSSYMQVAEATLGGRIPEPKFYRVRDVAPNKVWSFWHSQIGDTAILELRLCSFHLFLVRNKLSLKDYNFEIKDRFNYSH